MPNPTFMTVYNFTTKRVYPLLFCFLFCLFSTAAQYNLNNDSVAVSGYDVVSYFNDTPTAGKQTCSTHYEGATYWFSNTANKATFEENPEKYTPQYGGWCAYAMGYSGKKVSINPESYTIEKGKLYLFYRTTFVNTKKRWQTNTQKLKTKADSNWLQHTKH